MEAAAADTSSHGHISDLLNKNVDQYVYWPFIDFRGRFIIILNIENQ
jgi:hypothetical protein